MALALLEVTTSPSWLEVVVLPAPPKVLAVPMPMPLEVPRRRCADGAAICGHTDVAAGGSSCAVAHNSLETLALSSPLDVVTLP